MSVIETSWRGASKLVNPALIKVWGAWFVAEYRLKNMSKWSLAIVAFGLGNPILYLLSVGIGIGSLINKAQGSHGIEGVPYLTFLAPALLATAAIQGAMDEVTFPTLEGFSWTRVFFSMNATAITARQIVGGVMIASMARCILTTFLYEAVLLGFGAIEWSAVLPMAAYAVFAGFAFASLMLGVTSFVKEDDGFFAIVGRFVIAPMFMFSGTFYPISTLPIYLQWIGWISPLWHATNAGRALAYGHPVAGWLMFVHTAYLALMIVAGFWMANRQFEKRLAE